MNKKTLTVSEFQNYAKQKRTILSNDFENSSFLPHFDRGVNIICDFINANKVSILSTENENGISISLQTDRSNVSDKEFETIEKISQYFIGVDNIINSEK